MSRLTNLQFCQVWETDFRPWLCLAIRVVRGLRISHYLKLRHRGASWNDIDLPLDLIIIWLLKITNRTLTLWFNLSFLNEIGIFFKELVLSMFLTVFDDSLLRRLYTIYSQHAIHQTMHFAWVIWNLVFSILKCLYVCVCYHSNDILLRFLNRISWWICHKSATSVPWCRTAYCHDRTWLTFLLMVRDFDFLQ